MLSMNATRSNVRFLNVNEAPVVEMNTIETLQTEHGLESGRDVVERAVFEISDRLGRLEVALLEGDLADASKIASSVVAISRQIGLTKFANVAEHLVGAIQNNDFVAVAAVSRRLLRQGEDALFQAISLADMPLSS